MGIDGVHLTATKNSPPEVKPFHLVPEDSPTVWYGEELEPKELEYYLTKEDLAELSSAIDKVISSGRLLEEVTKDDFSLPTLGPKLTAIHDDLLFGRGIRVLKGLPLGPPNSERHAATAIWLLSHFFGKQQPLNASGHLIGHVKNDEGRLKRTSNLSVIPLGYHADNSDIVFLACRTKAKTGGKSSCVSSHALHNEILKRRPDLHKVLGTLFFQDRSDWWPAGTPPYYVSTFFHYHANTLGVQEVKPNLDDVTKLSPHVPTPTAIQKEALAFVQEVARGKDLRFDYQLEAGDLLLNHNLTTFHSRGTWEDGTEEHEKRHMLRIWIASPQGWPLEPSYAERWVTTEVGKRGGLDCPGLRPHIAITFEEYLRDQQNWYSTYGSYATTDYLKKGVQPGSEPIAYPTPKTGGHLTSAEQQDIPRPVQAAA